MEGPPDGATPSYKAVIVSRYRTPLVLIVLILVSAFRRFLFREELNMHSLSLIPDNTLTIVAKMVFVQVFKL